MTDDEQEIRSVVGTYVTGFNKGDAALLMKAFHPRFISSGFADGQLQWDNAEDFAAFCEAAAPDPEGPVPAWEIETLVVSGQTAVAVVMDRWGARQFRDNLTLLKDEGRWQIVFKAFHGLGSEVRSGAQRRARCRTPSKTSRSASPNGAGISSITRIRILRPRKSWGFLGQAPDKALTTRIEGGPAP